MICPLCGKERGLKCQDPCLAAILQEINATFGRRSLLSCCGHGKYPPTIVVLDKQAQRVFEWFSQKELPRYYKNGHVKRRYYIQDEAGFYFIPNVM